MRWLQGEEDDHAEAIVAEIEAPRFLDTSAIEVDVHPTWFQCVIKGNVILLHVRKEVSPDRSKVQRVASSGWLVLTMPVADHVLTAARDKAASLAKLRAAAARMTARQDGLAADDEPEEEEEDLDAEAPADSAGLGLGVGDSKRNAAPLERKRPAAVQQATCAERTVGSGAQQTAGSSGKPLSSGVGTSDLASIVRHADSAGVAETGAGSRTGFVRHGGGAHSAVFREVQAVRSSALEEAKRKREQREREQIAREQEELRRDQEEIRAKQQRAGKQQGAGAAAVASPAAAADDSDVPPLE